VQDASAEAARLENELLRKKMEILDAITDPVQKAEAYQKMFFAPSNNIIAS